MPVRVCPGGRTVASAFDAVSVVFDAAAIVDVDAAVDVAVAAGADAATSLGATSAGDVIVVGVVLVSLGGRRSMRCMVV